jgi:ATP-dependent Clp protease ATP-binding subunit ClpA
MERRKMVTIPQEEFEAMLERAAERGARAALHGVGLDGEDAAHDIREGNIIPFNFMTEDGFLVEIARSKLEPLRHRLNEKWGVAGLKFQDEVRALQAIVGTVDRSSGGRGVLNALTTSLFDPLAQFLFSEVGAPDRSQGRNILVVQAGSKAIFDFELE